MAIRALTNPEPGLLQSINLNSSASNQLNAENMSITNLTTNSLATTGTIGSVNVQGGTVSISGEAVVNSLTATWVLSGAPFNVVLGNIVSTQNLIECTGSFGTFGAESSIITRVGSFAYGTYTATFISTGAGGTLEMIFPSSVVVSTFVAGDALVTLTFRQTFTPDVQYVTVMAASGGSRSALGGILFPAGSYAVSGRFCVTCR